MPGGRLTLQARRQIAAALAEGRGYAEIARHLDRPTSTISREVARNGGPEGYRATQAHDATERRAHRRKSKSPPEPPTAVDAYGRDPAAVRRFVEEFATLMAQTGLPRMTTRVLTCLFTTDSGTLTAAELVQQLRVSPASISKAVGHLEELELVRRERDPGGRRERYFVDDDVWIRAWMASARKNAIWADVVRQGAEILGSATPAGTRLAEMGNFFAQLSDDMTGGSTPVTDDVLTLLAAFVQAGVPLTIDQLAVVLGWSPNRVTSAVKDAEQHPEWTDPIIVQRDAPDTYTVAARPDRLSTAQREALVAASPAPSSLSEGRRGGRSGVGC